VNNPGNVPRFDRRGARSATQSCLDGDPTCDFDGGVAGSCTFAVRVCINNADLAPCLADGRLASWSLDRPSAAQAAGRPHLAAVRAAFSAVPGAILGPLTPDLCTDSLAVPVPLRAAASGFKTGKLDLKTRVTRYDGSSDKDKLRLTCVPAGG
jgi:hypothetical protein